MKVLIVVDMQNDFIYGALGTKEAQAIVQNVKNKIEYYKNSGNPIIFTRDTHYKYYLETLEGKNLPVPHCIFGTDGWNIKEELETENCYYVDKESFGWPYWRDTFGRIILNDDLDEIEIVGLCTDICVISNALILKAIFTETPITVDASCCAGVTLESHKNALQAMKMCQINVINEEN